MQNDDIKLEKPIFIIGVGRSGTTLIQSMLNAHQDIAFTPETHFIRNFIVELDINPEDEHILRKKLVNDENLKRLDIKIDEICDELIDENEFTLQNFYNELLYRYAKYKNKKYIGEKDPKNTEYLPIIKRLFPDAYVINIIRDPRDVMVSRMKAEWSRDRYFLNHVLTYREQIKKGIKDGNKLFGNNYHELHYENLIEDPEKVSKDVTKFLDIQYDNNMLYFNKKADEIIKGKEKKWKENCFKSILSSNKNKWKDKLDKKKVLLTETGCKIAFEKYHYELSGYNENLDKRDKIYYFLIDKILLLIDFAYGIFSKYRFLKSKSNIK